MDNDENRMMVPAPETGMQVQTMGSQIATARRVEVARSMERVIKSMTFLAREAGDAYYYSIPFKDKSGKVTYVEGPSVTLIMDLAREYGNCVLSCDDIVEEKDAWIFNARFTDLERGFSLVRPFRQRRDQSTGMERRDPGRHQDILFQIGLSKALRNVGRNSLHFLAERTFEEAKGSKLKAIENDPEKARQAIIGGLAKMDADLKVVERSIGRVAKNWTAQDMAGIYGRLRAIYDHQSTFEEAFAIEEAVEAPTTKPAARDTSKMKPAPVAKEEEKKPAAKKEQPADAEKEQEAKPQEAAKQNVEDIPPALDRRNDPPPPEPEDRGEEQGGNDESFDPETGEVSEGGEESAGTSLFGDD